MEKPHLRINNVFVGLNTTNLTRNPLVLKLDPTSKSQDFRLCLCCGARYKGLLPKICGCNNTNFYTYYEKT